jgi:disulfide bond formation protein DsbB
VNTPTFSLFFALLALLCWLAVLATVTLAIVARVRPESTWASAFSDLEHGALWLAALVAIVAMLGSLYYSQVAHFIPCSLCWYQRIAMYPLAVVLLVAAVRHDRQIWWYAGPLALVGAAFAVYHSQLQAFPGQHSSFCTTTEPCTIRYVWEFGFVSLPFMALSAFAFIITMLILASSAGRRTSDPEDAE